jgi:hypothetical protein
MSAHARPARRPPPIQEIGTNKLDQRFDGMKRYWTHMPYRWPIENADVKLQEALDIALDYLEFTRQAYPFSEVEQACAYVILSAWGAGVRHRIRLANYAIVAIEQRRQKQEVQLIALRDFAVRGGW